MEEEKEPTGGEITLPEKKEDRCDAQWHVELNCTCPKCEAYVDLLTYPDFWDGRVLEIPEHDTENSIGVEVACPECHHEFTVDCKWQPNKEVKRKTFDLERCLAGDPVVTRDGLPYAVAGFNKNQSPENQLAGWVSGLVLGHRADGLYVEGEESCLDLFMEDRDS